MIAELVDFGLGAEHYRVGERSDKGGKYIRYRSRKSSQSDTRAEFLHSHGIYRHGLSPAEARQYHKNGTDGVEVIHRIEAYSARALGGIVTEPPGNEGVSALMYGNNEEQGQHPRNKL